MGTPIKKVDAKGEMQLKCPGGQITWPYAQLTLEEKKNVAVALAEAGGAAEHCLAGFFLFATGQREVGKQHLIKGGPGAAEVKALFK